MKFIRYEELPEDIVKKYGIYFTEDFMILSEWSHQVRILKRSIKMTVEYDCEITIKTGNSDIIINKVSHNVEVEVR